jgi:hypothetical protein
MGVPYTSARRKEVKKLSTEVPEDVLGGFREAVDSLYTTKIETGVTSLGVDYIDTINDNLTCLESSLEKIKYYQTNYRENKCFEKVEKITKNLKNVNTIHKLYKTGATGLMLFPFSLFCTMFSTISYPGSEPLIPIYLTPVWFTPQIIAPLLYLTGKGLAERWYKARNELYKIKDVFIQEVKRLSR